MARLNTYPKSDAINLEDFFVIDGPQGTKCVPINVVMNYIPSRYVTNQVLDARIGDDSFIADIDFASYFLQDNSIIAIVASAPNETEMLGKKVFELQNDVDFTGNMPSGSLQYVEDYKGFSDVAEEQEGNYLAIQLDLIADTSDANLSVRYSNTPREEIKIDKDKKAVIRVTNVNGDNGVLTVISSKNADEYIKRYDLNGLTLQDKVTETGVD